MSKKTVVLLFSFIILILSCNTTEPPLPGTNITLKTEDVSSIEVWIKITTNNIQLPANVTLKQSATGGNTVTQDIILSTANSIIYIDSLLPKTTYTFQAFTQSSIQSFKSNELSVTTMDTTSQNFTFETFEFGDGYSSSYFNDVWIFDENNIWAVGYISPSDTTINGTHITNPNIIKWDGISWKLQPYSGTSDGIYGMWALDSSKIFFASGIVLRYQNNEYEWEDFINVPLPNGQSVQKLWGSSLDNIWGIGPWGTIVHFNGQSWSKIDFDNQWLFYQLTGNPKTGRAYAVARNINFTTIIVELKNSSETEIIYNSDNSTVSIQAFSLTMVNDNQLYIAARKIASVDVNSRKVKLLYELPVGLGIETMASYRPNDIYFFGTRFADGQKMVHFNGVRFKIVDLSNNTGVIYGGSDAVKDFAVMGAFVNNKASLAKVKRN